MTIGERIREVRKKVGITQDDFSKKIGAARNTITNYEIGSREPMEVTIKAICREFNVNYEWLKEGIGEMFCDVPEEQRECGRPKRPWLLMESEFVENLLDFVARASKEGATDKEVEALPAISEIFFTIFFDKSVICPGVSVFISVTL